VVSQYQKGKKKLLWILMKHGAAMSSAPTALTASLSCYFTCSSIVVKLPVCTAWNRLVAGNVERRQTRTEDDLGPINVYWRLWTPSACWVCFMPPWRTCHCHSHQTLLTFSHATAVKHDDSADLSVKSDAIVVSLYGTCRASEYSTASCYC